MKTHIIFIAIIFTISTACHKAFNDSLPNPNEQATMEEDLQKQLNPNAQISFRTNSVEYSTECQLPACNLIIEEQYNLLLTKANSECLPQSQCVECCMNNWIAYAMLYVEPTALRCKDVLLSDNTHLESL